MMAARISDQSTRKLVGVYPMYFFVAFYYFIVNGLLTSAIVGYLATSSDYGAIFDGQLLFKFLFCMFSTVFLERVATKRNLNRFGPGWVYLCGVYFAIFTVIVYVMIVVKLWNTRSTDEIILNLFSIIDDLQREMIGKWPLEFEYYGFAFITALLIVPTPVLGIWMVIEMIEEARNPTTVDRMIYDPRRGAARAPPRRGGRRKRN